MGLWHPENLLEVWPVMPRNPSFAARQQRLAPAKLQVPKGYHQQLVTFGLDNYLQMTSSRHILQFRHILQLYRIYSSKSLRYSKDTRQPRIARTTTASNQTPMGQMKNHENHQQN